MAIGPFYEIDLFKNVAESCLQPVLENSRILEVGTAQSVKDSQVRLISHESIKALMECSPDFAHGVIGLISRRFDGFLRELETHALRRTRPRLATLLLTKEEEDVVSGVTHKDLAQELGIHRESVTAALGELQKADIIKIKIGRKKIRILHRARLERAARE